MNIHDLDMSAAKTLQMIYVFGGTAVACVVLVVILNLTRKIERLKKEINQLKEK